MTKIVPLHTFLPTMWLNQQFALKIPYRTKIRRTKVPKIWLGAENFVRRKYLSAENFVRRNILSAEILSKSFYIATFDFMKPSKM